MDWKTISAIFGLIAGVVNVICFIVIKFNDMKHLEKYVTSLDKKIDKLDNDNNIGHNNIMAILLTMNEKLGKLEGKSR